LGFDSPQDERPYQFLQSEPGFAVVETFYRDGEPLVELLVRTKQTGVDELE